MALAFLGVGTLAVAENPNGAASTVPLRVLDGSTGQPVSNLAAVVNHDKDKGWRGTTDAQGLLSVPEEAAQGELHVVIGGYEQMGAVTPQAAHDSQGERVVELIPSEILDAGHLGTRAFKLVDARTGKPVANAKAHVEFGDGQSTDLQSTALGYIFVSLVDCKPKVAATQVVVPGYGRKALDFCESCYLTQLSKVPGAQRLHPHP